MTRRERFLSHLLLIGFASCAVFPLLSLVQLAFTVARSPAAGAPSVDVFGIDNFVRAWVVGRFGPSLLSSFIVATCVLLLTITLSTMTGYAFGTMRFRASRPLFLLLLLGIILPYEATVVRLYYDLRAIHLTDTYWGLILPQVGLYVSFGTFWMRAFFRSTNRNLIEAAQIDGAGSMTILLRVLVPQARAALLSLAVLIFVWTWNEFLLALVLAQKEAVRTAPLALALFVGGQHRQEFPVMAAAAVLLGVPVLIVYSILQREFISGFVSGSVAGE